MTAFLNNWILKPELLPAWLQAGAAIIALGISVWAVWWTGAATRRRDRLEIRGLAVAVYPEIEMLEESTKTVRSRIAAIKDQSRGQVGQSVAANVSINAQIPIPPMMERNIDKLFILGDVAGPSCVHLVRLLIQYNTTVERFASYIMTLNAEQWIEATGHLEEHLALLDQVIAKCKHEVEPIHDAIKG